MDSVIRLKFLIHVMNKKSLVYTRIGYSEVCKGIGKRRRNFCYYWFKIVSTCGIRVINLDHLKQLWGKDLYDVASSYYRSGDFISLYRFLDRFPDLKTMHYGMSKYNISICLKAFYKRVRGFNFIKLGLFRIGLSHTTDCNRFNGTVYNNKEALEKTYNLVRAYFPDIDTDRDLFTQIIGAYRDSVLDYSEHIKGINFIGGSSDEFALILTILLGKLKLP